jgi:hypothetical protein
MEDAGIDKFTVVGLSGMMILGLLACFAYGQEEADNRALQEAMQKRREAAQEAGRRGQAEAFERSLERNPNLRAFYEHIDRGGSIQDSMKAMQDSQRQQILMDLKKQLGVSEEEWKVVQPRLEAVYLLRHPPGSVAQEDSSASAMVTRLTRELWELLNNKETKAEEIKAKLNALRKAKEKVQQELTKARQQLRQILTIRQEAVLVLSELLD